MGTSALYVAPVCPGTWGRHRLTTSRPRGWYLHLQHRPRRQAPDWEEPGVEVEHHLEGEAGQHLLGWAGGAGVVGGAQQEPLPLRRGQRWPLLCQGGGSQAAIAAVGSKDTYFCSPSATERGCQHPSGATSSEAHGCFGDKGAVQNPHTLPKPL